MVDNRLAGPCSDIVGVTTFVSAWWSLGGCAWLIGVAVYCGFFGSDAHVGSGPSWPVVHHAIPTLTQMRDLGLHTSYFTKLNLVWFSSPGLNAKQSLTRYP